MKVFHLDDSAILRQRVAHMLCEISADIELIGQSDDPRKAVEAIRALRPDVVILDLQMPGRSGVDVLRDIKKSAPVPVVMIFTNFPFPQYRQKCLKLGAEYFFDKSTEFEIFRGTLQQLDRDLQLRVPSVDTDRRHGERYEEGSPNCAISPRIAARSRVGLGKNTADSQRPGKIPKVEGSATGSDEAGASWAVQPRPIVEAP